jgi:UDP-glucose 6-dehydrogenase
VNETGQCGAAFTATKSGKEEGKDFGICVNPEFMRESTAIHDFLSSSIYAIFDS